MSADAKKNTVKTILSIVLNVFFYLIILFLLLFAIANMKVKTQADIPNIFGRGFLSVQSDSMMGNEEDSFDEGDMIFVKMMKAKDIEKLKVGDIVTWYDINRKAFNTHRIVDIGSNYFVTQGDKAADDPDLKYDPDRNDNNPNYYEIINKSDVKAVHVSTWKGAGKALDFLQSPIGFPLCIVLPAVLILIFEGAVLVRNVIKYNNAKMEAKFKQGKVEDLSLLEQEREKIRQEILQELKQKEQSQAEEDNK
jgi:signal peptidase